MSNRLADTIFQGKPTDNLVTQDAYQLSTSEVVNNLSNVSKNVFEATLAGLTKPSTIDGIVGLIQYSSRGNIDRISLLDRALRVMGSSRGGVLNSVSDYLKEKFASNAMKTLIDGAEQAVNIMYDGYDIHTSTYDVDTLRDIVELIGDMSPNSTIGKVIDIASETAILSAITESIVEARASALLDDVLNITTNTRVIADSLLYTTRSAINNGDLDTLEKIVDVSGVVRVTRHLGEPIKEILSKFVVPDSTSYESYPLIRTRLLAICDKLEPQWRNHVNRDGVIIPSLYNFIELSTDVKELMVLEEPERTLAMVADMYEIKSPYEVIKELYPVAYVPQ